MTRVSWINDFDHRCRLDVQETKEGLKAPLNYCHKFHYIRVLNFAN